MTLVVALLSFIGSALYSHRYSVQVDEDAVSIATNASPAIRHLSNARSEVLRVQIAASRLIHQAAIDGPPDLAIFEAPRQRLHRELASYLELPPYDGERVRYRAVEEGVAELERESDLLLRRVANRAAPHRMQSSSLPRAVERADDALAELLNFNAAEEHRLGLNIVDRRRRATQLLYALDTLTALFALVLLALVFRVGKQQLDLLLRKRAAEDRASSYASFNRRLQRLATAAVEVSGAIARASHPDGWAPLFFVIVEQARRVTGADHATLSCALKEVRQRASEQAAGDGGAAGEHGLPVATSGTPPGAVTAQEAGQTGSVLELSLEHDGVQFGQLHLERGAAAGAFTDEERHTAALLAAHAAVTLENVRLYHAVERERARLQLLSEASLRMAGSLDLEQTLGAVSKMAVPGFADGCMIDLVDRPAGVLHRVAVAARDEQQQQLLRSLGDRYPPRLDDSQHPFVRAVASRETVRLDESFEATFAKIARDPEHLDLLRQIGCRSLLVVPLMTRAHLVGVCVFFSASPDRFGPEDVTLAEELSRRAALSIENARLYGSAERAIRAREELLAVVSHDLRTPLAAIKMSGSLLRELVADENQRAHYAVERVLRGADRMNGMIADLLEAAQIEAGSLSLERAPEPIAPMLSETLELFAELAAERRLQLDAELAPQLPPVLCERERILRVLSNLVGNAIKFTPAGGTIALSAGASGDAVKFCVRDTGPGIPEEKLAHLFDRYWQQRGDHRGVGLGLYIAKGIVEEHGGQIGVESVAGRGATFWFTLPAGHGLRERAHAPV